MKLRHLARPRGSAFAAGLLLAAAAVLNPAQAQQKRPNLAMLTDDTSWDDLGAYSGNGLSHATPNVDQVAKEYNVFNLHPGVARVWVLRQPNPPGGNFSAANPMIFANGAPLAQSAPATVFFHDFQPGTYRFTVQPDGIPASLVDTLQLAPETEVYVQVQAVPKRTSTASGASFAVLTMSPAEAKAYLPTLTNLGQR
jgi:hypothetical protein